MWSDGRCVGGARVVGRIDQLGGRLCGALAAVWLLSGCGNGQSPTEAARLAEARRLEAQQAKTPDVIDALFLGSGPLIPRDGHTDCPFQGFWSGYPRGSVVRVRVSSRVPGPVQASLAAAVGPLSGATG